MYFGVTPPVSWCEAGPDPAADPHPEEPPMPRRILLYSHDTVGLGHIRRVTRLARRLAERERDSTVLVLTGSPVADS